MHHGINLMLITVVPKRFIKSGKVSTFSGILNAGTYIGSTVGTLLFPMLIGTSEDIANGNVKWEAAMLVWVVIAALGTAVCFVAVPLWRKFRREYTDT
jgi:OPA family glycerol-3-phosphate transporter-like MFS transporter